MSQSVLGLPQTCPTPVLPGRQPPVPICPSIFGVTCRSSQLVCEAQGPQKTSASNEIGRPFGLPEYGTLPRVSLPNQDSPGGQRTYPVFRALQSHRLTSSPSRKPFGLEVPTILPVRPVLLPLQDSAKCPPTWTESHPFLLSLTHGSYHSLHCFSWVSAPGQIPRWVPGGAGGPSCPRPGVSFLLCSS